MIDASNRVSTTEDKEIVEGAAKFTALLQGRSNSPRPNRSRGSEILQELSRCLCRVASSRIAQMGIKGMKIQAAMQRGIDPEGGYLAPVEMTQKIMRLSEETNPITKYATIIKTNSAGLYRVHKYWGTRLSVGSGSRSIRSETTTPTYGKWRIDVKKLYAYPRMTPEMVADSSIDIEKELTTHNRHRNREAGRL